MEKEKLGQVSYVWNLFAMLEGRTCRQEVHMHTRKLSNPLQWIEHS